MANLHQFLQENPVDSCPIMGDVLLWTMSTYTDDPELAGFLAELGFEVLGMVGRLEELGELKLRTCLP